MRIPAWTDRVLYRGKAVRDQAVPTCTVANKTLPPRSSNPATVALSYSPRTIDPSTPCLA